MRREYATLLGLIGELETRDVARTCGYSGLGELLRDVLRISRAEANRRIAHAHAVTDVALVSGGVVEAPLPRTAVAMRAGELGPEHLEVIAKTLGGLPASVTTEERRWAEDVLVQAAASMDARTLTRVGRELRARLDQDGQPPADAELAHPRNELHVVTRANGRSVGRFSLDREASALLHALLAPLARPRPRSEEGADPRSAPERNGDALAEILQLAAGGHGLSPGAGERPHLLVTVPLSTLRDGLGGALLDGAATVDAASARRLACDSKVVPVVLGATSEPLDIGRISHTVPAAIRRALILRDGGCAFPGCDRPHRWCQAHHITHWADGGATELDNLVLLCGHHHRLLHHSEWECVLTDGRPEFVPPRYVDPRRRPRRNLVRIS